MVPWGIKTISLCSFMFPMIISDCSHNHKMVHLYPLFSVNSSPPTIRKVTELRFGGCLMAEIHRGCFCDSPRPMRDGRHC